MAGLVAGALCGCTAHDIDVVHAELGVGGHNMWIFAYVEEPSTIFSTEEDIITLAARLGYNLVGHYLEFRAHWVAPNGNVFLDAPVRTQWGTHQAVLADLPVRWSAAHRFPGLWKVRLVLQGRVLAERQFRLLTPEALDEYAATGGSEFVLPKEQSNP